MCPGLHGGCGETHEAEGQAFVFWGLVEPCGAFDVVAHSVNHLCRATSTHVPFEAQAASRSSASSSLNLLLQYPLD